MPLKFLLDEHFRGLLWQAVRRHNASSARPLDVACVGDFQDLPLGTPDPEILAWAEREGRILVSRDYHTMPDHLSNHLRNGQNSPGVLLATHRVALREIVEALETIAYTGLPEQYADSLRYFP